MQDLKNKSLDEINEICAELGFSPFKAREIFRSIHHKLKNNIDDFTTIKQEEREKLKKSFYISSLSPHKVLEGKDAKKVTFELNDGKVIEAVYMDNSDERKTVCISSQVGCPMECSFCATGGMGFVRNLTLAEILDQVYYFARQEKISNIVFMGMGEPLLNYNNVIAAARILNDEKGLNIASRKIVISTIGIVLGIKKFMQEGKQFRLAWSLVAPFDGLRKKLIKSKKLASIDEIIFAFKEYQDKTKRRITIEYVVMGRWNDGEMESKELAEISKKFDSYVNLIPYNPSPRAKFKRGNTQKMFVLLKKSGVNVTVRRSLGQDISAACGQLVTTAL